MGVSGFQLCLALVELYTIAMGGTASSTSGACLADGDDLDCTECVECCGCSDANCAYMSGVECCTFPIVIAVLLGVSCVFIMTLFVFLYR